MVYHCHRSGVPRRYHCAWTHFLPLNRQSTQVFECLQKAKLKLFPKKCTLFKTEVKYLGHTVSGKGIAPDQSKLEAVMQWPRPTTASEIKSFLGLCSYCRQFVPSFAKIAHPLHQLASLLPFKWTDEAEEAFQKLKLALTNPILAYPDPSSEFILNTDASASRIRAVLSQELSIDKQESGGILQQSPNFS